MEGAKGFYSLGVIREIEALVGCRLYEKFDLIFGTSTGGNIAALSARLLGGRNPCRPDGRTFSL